MYVRRSQESDERQVASIPAQKNELQRVAERQDLQVVGDPLEESMSAKRPGRPIFNEMVRRIEQGQANAVLCWHVDRLARNPVDGGQLVWLLGEGIIKRVVTPQATYTPSSDDKLIMLFNVGMATKYVDDLSLNVKRGNREALEGGRWPNRAPLGYLRDPRTKQLVPDPKRFELVREMWRLRLMGVSVPDVTSRPDRGVPGRSVPGCRVGLASASPAGERAGTCR